MRATSLWYASSSSEYSAGEGTTGVADLRYYNATYREWGSGPPLVLIPGLAGGFELLGPLARALSDHYRVISFQLRGEEDCFALRRWFGMNDLVDDIAEFLDWRGLERPLIAGVSFGGVLALQFAARFPNRLQALGVQGVGVRFERGLVQSIASMVLANYPLPADSPFVNQFFNLLFGCPAPQPVFDFVTRLCWQTDQGVMAHRMQLLRHLDLSNRLASIHTPTQVVSGPRDLLVTRRNLESLVRGLPAAQPQLLDGGGHLAFVTHAPQVANSLQRFFAEVSC